MKEPQTPNSPSEQPEYLELIPGEADSDSILNDETIYGNPEAPPPGMCIPKEYMNSVLAELCTARKRVSSRASSISGHNETPEDDGQRPTSAEYIESDVINGAINADNESVDTTDLPEYVNVGVANPINFPPQGKKLPAPPVPPRNKT